MAGFMAEGMNFAPAGVANPNRPRCHSSTCCVEFVLGAADVQIGGSEVGPVISATEAGTRQLLGTVGTLTLRG